MKYYKRFIAAASAALLVLGFIPAFVQARATVQNTSMPDGTVGQAYSLQFTAQTDDPPVTFQKWYWTYPGNEMSLSGSGLFTGTPTQAGNWEVGLRAEDGTGTGVYAVLTWKVNVASTQSSNTLTVTNDTSLVTGPIPPGAQNYTFAAFNLKAGQTPVTLTSLRVVSDSANNVHFTNISLYKDRSQFVGGTASVLGSVVGSTRYSTFNFSPAITIPVNGTVLLQASASLTDQIPSGQIRLGLDSPTFTGTSPTISPALPIYGNYITVTGSTTNPGSAVLTVTTTPASCTATSSAVNVSVQANSGAYVVKKNGADFTTLTFSQSSTGSATDTVAIGSTNTYTLFLNGQQIGSAQTATGTKQSSCGAGGTLAITTSETLPDGTVGQAYSQTLQVSGGTAPYTWSVTNGTYNIYPCCYATLSSAGSFTSVASTTAGLMPFAGTYQLPVTVVDAAGVSAQKTLQFTIKSQPNPTPTPTPTPTSTPTPTGTPRNEGYVDALSATNVSGWAYTSIPRQETGPSIVIVFESTTTTSQTYTLNLKPSQVRSDVNTYLQNKYGLTNISVATGFSGNPSSVITTNGTYRIKSATYDGISFVLSDAAKRSFTVGGGVTPNLTGKYVKVDGDQTVYWIAPWGGKMPMLTAQVFASYGGRFENVITISQEALDDYDDVRYIKVPSNARVYQIESGVKRYITPAAATRLAVDPNKVVTVNQTEFFSYRTGATVQ